MSCPDCFRGGVSDQKPTGVEETIHGLPTYVARPDGQPKGIIVYLPDAFGWKFVNNRVLADRYAKQGGYLVYLPECMNGAAIAPEALPLVDAIMEPSSWFTTLVYKPFYIVKAITLAAPMLYYATISATKGTVLKFVQDMRTSPPPFATDNLKVGAAGFCWGGKHCFLLAADNEADRVGRHESQTNAGKPQTLLDCVFTAHPSALEVPKDAEAVVVPTSLCIGDVDMALGIESVNKVKDILEAKEQGMHEVVVLPGAKHGFAVRSHPDDEYEMACAGKAEKQALAWFERWLN